MDFWRAWVHTMRFEGGGKVHETPGDPGGVTKWGIAQTHHPEVQVAFLSAMEAMDIARDEYWEPLRADELPPALRWDVFDFAFNAGTRTSARTLQMAINICHSAKTGEYDELLRVDGVLGPVTVHFAQQYPAERIRRVFRAYRSEHYIMLAETGRAQFIEGWLKRAQGEHDG